MTKREPERGAPARRRPTTALRPCSLALVAILASVPFSAARAATGNPAEQCGKESDFNSCVLAAVDRIHASREGLGYAQAYFTKDLDYGPDRNVVRASKLRPKTMCVAAVAEIVIEALNVYYENTGDKKPFTELAAKRWNGTSALDIRDYVWENRGSHSAGYAFEKFGLGEMLAFEHLRPGDFLSFDRARNGHSTIFVSYLDREYRELSFYGPEVVGFRYYSSQSSHDAGFGYRWAFFKGSDGGGVCEGPDTHPDKYRDCAQGGVLRQSVNGRGGRLFSPVKWAVRERRDDLIATLSATIRPVVEEKFAALLELAARLKTADPASDPLADQLWAAPLSRAPGLAGMLADGPKLRAILSDPDKRKELMASPEWKALVDAAVLEELERESPEVVDPKFLGSDNG